jgi:rhodanese-related sulfurtransferase
MQQISPAELQQKLSGKEAIFLIDVRELHEHEAYNIGGVLMPLPDIMNHAVDIPKDKTVVMYCKMGIRSQIAIQRLQDKFGFTNLINLKGGMEAWKKEFPSL